MLRVQRRRRGGKVRAATIAMIASIGIILSGGVAAQSAVGDELITNGAFGTGSDGWSAQRGGTLELSDDGFGGSGSSLAIVGRTTTQSSPFYDISGKIKEGDQLRLTAQLKYDEGDATKNFNFTLCPDNYDGAVCKVIRSATAQKGEWLALDVTFTATTDEWDWLFFENNWSSSPTASDIPDFKIDNVSLVKTTEAPGEEEPPAPERRAVEDVLVKGLDDHNPINPWKFGADPTGLEWEGRLYVYATNDNQDYTARDKDAFGYATSDGQYNVTTLNVSSTTDMVNWVDHGEVPVAGPDGVAPWAGRSWAPAAIAREVKNPETGEMETKIFLYFCNGGSGTAVLMGDSPLGPWHDVRSEAGYTGNDRMLISQGNPIQFKSGMWLFDPEIFVDDDGQAYLYFGGNTIGDAPKHPKSTAVVKLRDNMYEVACDGEGEESCEDAVRYIDAPGVFEASSMMKHDGKYYYTYSANFGIRYEEGKYPSAGSIPYMITDDPMSLTPENYVGVAFENPNSFFQDAGGNNHSDIMQYKDRTYFLYHSRTLGKAWKEGTATTFPVWGNLRNTHVEEMSFNEDGLIVPIQGTRSGATQIENFDPYGKIEAQTFAWQQGTYFDIQPGASSVFPEHNNGGNVVLTRIEDQDWTGISQVDFGTDGAESFTARVMPKAVGGSIEIRLDDPVDGAVVATLPVDSTIGEWAELTTEVSGATGVHDVFFVFTGSEPQTVLFDADYWEFAPVDPTGGEVTFDDARTLVDQAEAAGALNANAAAQVRKHIDQAEHLASGSAANQAIVAQLENAVRKVGSASPELTDALNALAEVYRS
ncbi:arabinoxylan arabinofuranohydrolase [Microbacterium sp. W4I4]|nr:arabinoxylan arabinofuranohydrolase [Microbacterium sp. W4I4]